MFKHDLSHLYYDPGKSQDWWHRVASRTLELSSVAKFPDTTRINHVSSELFEEFKTTRCWSVYPDAIDFLEHCRDNALPMAGISNFDQRLSPLLCSLSISKYFLFVMSLAYKPSTYCFQEALKRTGYDPKYCCHIGDSIREDCVTALSIGMKPVLINRREDEKYIIQQLKDSGVGVEDLILVKSLSELKNKIKINK
ncbi:hypothetical protein LOD99_2750 [Oopsacas minuta]|uniref:Uncharacterized protein n=1 Tax=Oopsacas minuta TaxID=111878 RepID=A0AAV7K1U7_9METZ|nr:hypothetical protein LOD99_2750 [Oopsacas minuta]